MRPDVDGLSGLDVGCGEGHNTRLLAERGARMTGIDISRNFVRYARVAPAGRPLGIRFERASAVNLPFESASFEDARIVAHFLHVRARKPAGMTG